MSLSFPRVAWEDLVLSDVFALWSIPRVQARDTTSLLSGCKPVQHSLVRHHWSAGASPCDHISAEQVQTSAAFIGAPCGAGKMALVKRGAVGLMIAQWEQRSLGRMAAPDQAVGEMSLGRMAAPEVTVGEMSLGRMAALDDVLLDLKAGMGSLDCGDHDPMEDLGIEAQHAPPQQTMDAQTEPPEPEPAPNGASSASGLLPPEVDLTDEAQVPSDEPDAGDAPQKVDLKSEAALAARLELPGADSSGSDYSARWERYRAIFATLNEAEHGAPVMPEVSIIPETARLSGIVTDTYPGWGASQQSLGVAALYMYNKRLTDLCERDNAHLLWIVCGNHLLRAHAGKTYCYNVMYGKWDLQCCAAQPCLRPLEKLRLHPGGHLQRFPRGCGAH